MRIAVLALGSFLLGCSAAASPSEPPGEPTAAPPAASSTASTTSEAPADAGGGARPDAAPAASSDDAAAKPARDAAAPDVVSDAGAAATPEASPANPPANGRGVPAGAPWLTFYGTPAQMGDLSQAASTFRLINLDADPAGAFTTAQIAELRSGGQNRVISYLDVGSCENYRSWWTSAPGHKPCSQNTAAQIGPYGGYPNEVWMNLGNADYQDLIVNYVAPLLAARGVDGFFLDNLEIVEHGTSTTDGPCDSACAQGGLDLVRKLRQAFPDKLIVMNNATSDVTRLGTTGGVPFPSLLDGISRESVYTPSYDSAAESQLLAWQKMNLSPGGHPFWLATEDFVGDCAAASAAQTAYTQSRAKGFSPYATNASAGQTVICYWSF